MLGLRASKLELLYGEAILYNVYGEFGDFGLLSAEISFRMSKLLEMLSIVWSTATHVTFCILFLLQDFLGEFLLYEELSIRFILPDSNLFLLLNSL